MKQGMSQIMQDAEAYKLAEEREKRKKVASATQLPLTKASLARHEAAIASGDSPEPAEAPSSPLSPTKSAPAVLAGRAASPTRRLQKRFNPPPSFKSPVEGDFTPKKSIWNKELTTLAAVQAVEPQRSNMPAWKVALERIRTPTKVKRKKRSPPPWDKRHQLGPMENAAKHPSLRDYFATHETLDELKENLRLDKKRPGTASLLAGLAEKEDQRGSWGHPQTLSPLSADAELGALHQMRNSHGPSLGGSMADRDDNIRGWNNRFHSSPSNHDRLWHRTQREYFGNRSTFVDLPSQQWRRQVEYEVEPGIWRSTQTSKPTPLGPLGGRTRSATF
jgi:hypothetical protein